MRVNGDLAAATDRLREIAATLDPNLTIDDIRTLDDIYRQRALGNNLGAFAIVAACLSVIILSAAGIYAMMSFTVNQRRREIGIRSALGAQPRHMLRGIFSKALRQVVAGVVVGLAASMLLRWYWPAEDAGGWPVPGILPAAAIFMSMVGLLAAAGPARRALRVQPTEALRDGT
jgi:ABC-type antimicrobial peptide transport system permease subunit